MFKYLKIEFHKKKGFNTPLFLCINTHMNDKKAAKKIIKIAKKHPNLYTKQDVRYAKLVKKRLKNKKNSSK